MNATPEQLNAAGSAARDLLRFAWSRQPRIALVAITGITAVAKTMSTDIVASTTLLRRAIEPEHLREHGHEELRWLTRQIGRIVDNDPNFAIDIYRAAYAYEESSDAKTGIGNSAILPLSSNRRQDYEGAWFLLSEAIPIFLDRNLEAGTHAVARSLEGYVKRKHATHYGDEPEKASFSLGSATANFSSDTSHSWYRGGYQPRQDAPAVLTKFDAYLEKIAQESDAEAKLERVLNVLAAESGLAVLWASLLVAATWHPEKFAKPLVPLACAEPVMLSSDTRHQLGTFITAAYPSLCDSQRAAIERAILSLSGERPERIKTVLAGCIPKKFVATSEMSQFLENLEKSGASRPNVPPFQMTSSVRAFDTDAYLESEGVSLEDPHTSALRELMRRVEEIPNGNDAATITLKVAQQHLHIIEALRKGLATRSKAKVPVKLSEHACGILADATARLSRAALSVTGSKMMRPGLKRALLFCATSANPHFEADHEKHFHESLSWGGPSARTSAAGGLLNLIRGDKTTDPKLLAAIRKLARDPVAHVRLQIIQNLNMLRNLDPKWAWSEIEHVAAKEPTRGVVGGALGALGRLAYLDLSRAIRIAKGVIHRYRRSNGPGMADCRASAATLIFDIHFVESNAEANEFASKLMADVVGNADTIKQFIARYSDYLLVGKVSDPKARENEYRRKALAFYACVTERAFAEIEERSRAFDVRKFATWPSDAQETVRSMFGILDEVSIRLYFASGASHDGSAPSSDMTPERARLFREALLLFEQLAGAIIAPIAHHLIQALEMFIPLEPAGVFALIAQSVRSSEQGGYGLESMAADLIVRIVERYLADYRSIFADAARLKDLMDCLDVFVRAGWPSAQSLTFRLGEIWR
ncbi:MAG: hypothetical protein ACLQME_13895 [Alphaproteobacteria bacterium]